jgi:hypothetical protein
MMQPLKTYLFLIVACFFSLLGKGQDTAVLNEIRDMENALKSTSLDIVQAPVEAWRRKATADFLDSFRTILEYPESFNYPFDSILTIEKILSPDKKIRIITLNLILNNQDHHCYGFIQRKTKKGIELYELKDTLQTLPREHLFAELYSNEWIGSIYYSIKQLRKKGVTYYTVLGYDGATRQSSKKWADVIWFNKEGELSFGYPLFRMYEDDYEPQYRFEIEYANEANIVLRHETSNKNNRDMIIFSHVGAQTPDFKGVRSSYYPDGTYDFFLFEKKKWVMYKNLMYFDFKQQ